MSDQPRLVEAPTFLITKEYRRFAEFCDAVKRYRYIGVCYGPSGVGKTISARHYTHWDQLGPLLDQAPFAPEVPRPPEIVTWRSILYTPTIATAPKHVADGVDRLSRGLSWEIEAEKRPDDPDLYHRWRGAWTELVLVEEADRLKLAALETLRDHYDRGQIGLVLIGMPGLERRLARYPQFYSRIGFVHEFRTLSEGEMSFVLACQWQRLGLLLEPDNASDAEAMATIMRITGGNFRLIERLFSQIDRVLKINNLQAVTREAVETARESLVIGPP
jgi:DNA transposition AAA+ family ATPase